MTPPEDQSGGVGVLSIRRSEAMAIIAQTAPAEPPEGLSILRACTGRYATKRFHRRRDGTVDKTSYGNEKWFAIEQAIVSGIHDLAALLDPLQHDPHAFIVRGALLPHADPRRTRRLLHPDP